MERFSYLWEYVGYWGQADPAFPALQYNGATITYGELDSITDNMAKHLLQWGVQKGDTVITMLPCSSQYIITLLAADKIGAITVPLDVKYRTDDLMRFMRHVHPSAVISVPEADGFDVAAELKKISEKMTGLDGVLWVFTEPAGFGKEFSGIIRPDGVKDISLDEVQKQQHPDDGMVIVFTGGTTGVPKAALLSKQNVTAMAAVEAEFLGEYIPGRIKTIASLPPSHVGGTVEMICMALAGGFEIFVHDAWSPQRVLETTQKEGIPWIGGVPTMYAITMLLPDLDSYDFSSLKIAVFSGEKVDLELLHMVQEKICPNIIIGYGSTEAGSEVTFTKPGTDEKLIADGYVGTPLPGVEIRIADEKGNVLPAGDKGEVQVQSPYTIKSYYHMPDEDSAGFTPDGFCKTGDLGVLDKDGGLYIKGRLKHIIRVGSYTVMPSEVEEVIIKTGKVGMAAVIGIPDRIYGEIVWAVVSPMPGANVTEEEIITHCKQSLAGFKVPKRVLVQPELPMTRIGKVHRVKVQEDVISQLKTGSLQEA